MQPVRPSPNAPPPRWAQWRAERLRSAGFPPPLAQRLAGEARTDLHELLKLVDQGCPPGLAARILAPLDDPRELAARLLAPLGNPPGAL